MRGDVGSSRPMTNVMPVPFWNEFPGRLAEPEPVPARKTGYYKPYKYGNKGKRTILGEGSLHLNVCIYLWGAPPAPPQTPPFTPLRSASGLPIYWLLNKWGRPARDGCNHLDADSPLLVYRPYIREKYGKKNWVTLGLFAICYGVFQGFIVYHCLRMAN